MVHCGVVVVHYGALLCGGGALWCSGMRMLISLKLLVISEDSPCSFLNILIKDP